MSQTISTRTLNKAHSKWVTGHLYKRGTYYYLHAQKRVVPSDEQLSELFYKCCTQSMFCWQSYFTDQEQEDLIACFPGYTLEFTKTGQWTSCKKNSSNFKKI